MDAIADHIWQSTIFAAVAATIAWAFRHHSASARYWIWFAAAVKFLVPLTALAAAANQIPLPRASVAGLIALDAATLVFRASAIPYVSGAPAVMMCVVWLAGAGAILGRAVWHWKQLSAEARRSPLILDGAVWAAVRRAEHAQRVAKPIRIVALNGHGEPGVIGIWRPVLMWPRHLTVGLSDAHVEAIVAHEVCHVVRRDNLLASVQIVVSAVFWFHPLVWLIGARLVDERERACDERVLALGAHPGTYADGILRTCRLCIASPVASVSGVTGGSLKQRVMRIMKNEPSRPFEVRQKAVLLVAALVTLLVPTTAGMSACRSDTRTDTGQQIPVHPSLPSSEPEVYRPGGSVTTPRLVRESKPQYTARALQEKVQGEVVMECVVTADGTVGDKKVVKSLHPDLDQAALDAAAQWRFEPGTRNGRPLAVLVTISMAFTLK